MKEVNPLHNLGEVASERHDFSKAWEAYRESLRIRHLIGDVGGEVSSLCSIGGLAVRMGRHVEARAHLERGRELAIQVGQRSDEGSIVAWLGLLACSVADYEQAGRLSTEALAIGRETSSPRLIGRSLDHLGRALEGQRSWDAAREAYEQAYDCLVAGDDRHFAVQARSGLGRVALALGDMQTARAHVDTILDHLAEGDLAAVDSPVLVYLTCYRVLEAAGDPRRHQVLEDGHRFVRKLAERIRDPELRKSFLEDVPDNREFCAVHAAAASIPR